MKFHFNSVQKTQQFRTLATLRDTLRSILLNGEFKI